MNRDKLKTRLYEIQARLRGAMRSKTAWFNGLCAVAMVKAEMLQQALPQLAPYMKPENYQHLMLGILVVNLVLRFVTTKSLAEK
jgi:hypothetical protein